MLDSDCDCDKIEIWILIEFSYKILFMFRIEFVVLEKMFDKNNSNNEEKDKK